MIGQHPFIIISLLKRCGKKFMTESFKTFKILALMYYMC